MTSQRQKAKRKTQTAVYAPRTHFVGPSCLCFLSFALCLWPFLTAAKDVPLVRVNAECIARADVLKLGDLAEVIAAEPAVAARLRAVTLGYAPSVGTVRELPRERIALAITAAGFAIGAVRLDAPTFVVVRRATQTIAPERVQAVVETATLTELRSLGAAARLARLDLPPLIEVPAGEVELRANYGGVRDVFSPFIVAVEFWQAGRVVYRLSATAQVEAFLPVAVAARDLPSNVRLQRTDYNLEPRKLTRMPATYMRDAANLRGVSLRRPVARGEALTAETVQSDIVIRTGDVVRVVSQAGRIEVIAQGEARAAGRIGDRIQIKNQQSGQLLQAVVVDEALVRVVF